MNMVGTRWKAVLNGKKALNGARYGATFTGEVTESMDSTTLYDVVSELMLHLEEKNAPDQRPGESPKTL